jgi:hypothetical protein
VDRNKKHSEEQAYSTEWYSTALKFFCFGKKISNSVNARTGPSERKYCSEERKKQRK